MLVFNGGSRTILRGGGEWINVDAYKPSLID